GAGQLALLWCKRADQLGFMLLHADESLYRRDYLDRFRVAVDDVKETTAQLERFRELARAKLLRFSVGLVYRARHDAVEVDLDGLLADAQVCADLRERHLAVAQLDNAGLALEALQRARAAA